MTTGPGLFSLFPPAFTTVPQYLVHITVELLPLTEPDKRLSHTSGSSVHPSVRLRSTIRVEVFTDSRLWPLRPDQCLGEALPGECLALALAVEPFKQDMFCAIDIVAAPYRVVRYGVITQMPAHSCSGLSEHLPFSQHMSGFLCPVRELTQTLPQFLATGTTFNLEVSLPGLAAIMRKPQKGKLLWFLAASVRIFACKTAKFDAACFLFCQFKTKALQAVFQASLKILRIALVLKAGQKIIGKPKIIRFTATLSAHPSAEPQVQHVVQVDIRQQRRQDRPLRGPPARWPLPNRLP